MKRIKNKAKLIMLIFGIILYTIVLLLICKYIYKAKLQLKDNEILNITEELIIAKNSECKYYFEELDRGFIIDGSYYEYKQDLEEP